MNDNKPLILAMEDVKNELINFINDISNNNNLSYYFLEIILKEIYQEVLDKKTLEIETVKKQYLEENKGSDE